MKSKITGDIIGRSCSASIKNTKNETQKISLRNPQHSKQISEAQLVKKELRFHRKVWKMKM